MGTAVFTRLRTWLQIAGQAALARLPRRSTGIRESLSGDTHPFDRRHRVDTAGLFYADQLVTGHPRDPHSAGYYATAPSLVHAALRHWADTLTETGYSLPDYALLDIGCGKGRVLLLASDYPFRQITGIELHPGLASIARRNLRRWLRTSRSKSRRGPGSRSTPSRTTLTMPGRRYDSWPGRSSSGSPDSSVNWLPARSLGSWRSATSRRDARPTQVEIMQGDALSIPFPRGPLVVYFFNSFEREMVDPFLDKLLAEAASRIDPVDLIYIHPEFGALVRRRPGVRLLVDIEIPYSPEDAQADAFGTDFDRVAIYRLTPSAPHRPEAA